MDTDKSNSRMDRRSFLRSAAAASAGLAMPAVLSGQTESRGRSDDINVALLGAGTQGYVLLNACLKIPGVRFNAVCDIWEKYSLTRTVRLLKAYKHEAAGYIDYREMLASHKDLDAVIIATPDFWHAEHTVACLNAGLHVYCEKEMSNTLEGARKMAQAARKSGKLLQIGHQRRSNPRYILCKDKLIEETNILGRITAVNGQWNRSAREQFGWPKNKEIDAVTLGKYGYESMHQYRNWRWYKKLGGGPIVDLGSHQIDVYSWFLGANPSSVIASGRTNYYDKNTHEWYDTVMAVFEYDGSQGSTSAYYQVLTANSSLGYFEKFMGDQGTLVISEAGNVGAVYPEPVNIDAAAWAQCFKKRYLSAPKEVMDVIDKMTLSQIAQVVQVDRSPDPDTKNPTFALTVELDKPYHQPHLENFFEAIRGKANLNCPAEIGYETAVAVLKVNEAIEAGQKLSFKPDEFKA